MPDLSASCNRSLIRAKLICHYFVFAALPSIKSLF